MDKVEARAMAQQRLDELRRLRYSELCELDAPTEERVGPSGSTYQLACDTMWDDGDHRNLRVVVMVDDGGWRAFAPLCEAFIMRPDGSFVGE